MSSFLWGVGGKPDLSRSDSRLASIRPQEVGLEGREYEVADQKAGY
jgi:hypothetical protein